ncbi:MAG: hypothetical protein WBD63_06310, partial [Phycisphaerae bacterium]
FNRSRSFRLIRSSILVLLPATRPERGQFYFAETGHYHFAATLSIKTLTGPPWKPRLFHFDFLLRRADA